MVGLVDVPLRRLLIALLGALVVTGLLCFVDPRGASPVALVDLPAPAPVTVSPSPPAAPLKATGSCGFALGSTAPAAPVGHCTVLEVGDSLGSDLGWGLQREVAPAAGLQLVQLDKSGTGLANTSSFDWHPKLAAALATYHPQVVLIFLGGNDEQGLYADHKPVQFGQPAWTTEYVTRVHELAAEATEAGAFVLWVGLPVMQQSGYSKGAAELDADVRAGIADLPAARFLDTRALFASSSGAYQASAVVNGARTSLRNADGIHFSFDGEDVIATWVLQQMSSLFDVHLAATHPEVIQR